MSGLAIERLPLGVALVSRRSHADARGRFARLFCRETLAACGWDGEIAQINFSATDRRGTVRGMHFQHPPHAEAKLVNCVRGAIFDVAIDVRAGSPSFLQWEARELSDENGLALLIPPGFAHGFQALTDDVEMVYCHSRSYDASAEDGLDPLDPRIAIPWPLPPGEISDRDRNHPSAESFSGVRC